MKEFAAKAELDMIELFNKLEEMKFNYKELADFFGEDSLNLNQQDFFSIIQR
jgi:hypothetical protein